jgi:hypothetical protein
VTVRRLPRPAKVIWHDACGGKTGWLSSEEATKYKPYAVESFGWLIRNDAEVVTLTISRHPTQRGDMFADTLDIPRGMVRKVTFL